MSPRVVLVGPPGAGKSTIGAALAARWGTEFLDTDAEIERREGSSIADLFVERGEPYFRSVEAAVIQELLAAYDGVLSLGGGAVLDEGTRTQLADERVVLLDAGLAALAQRVGLNRDRPLLLGNVRATLANLLNERRPHYLAVSDLVVQTDERTPESIVDEVVRWEEQPQ
jgi:shikimate kinase